MNHIFTNYIRVNRLFNNNLKYIICFYYWLVSTLNMVERYFYPMDKCPVITLVIALHGRNLLILTAEPANRSLLST